MADTLLDKWKKRQAKRKAERDAQHKADTANASKIIKIAGKEDITEDDLKEAGDLSRNNPRAGQLAADHLRQEQGARTQERLAPLLNTIVNTAGVVASIGQINRANKAAGNLVAPGIPSPPPIDPALNQQLYNAQLGSMNAGRAKGAADVGINDAYNQAVADAGNTAAGQSGTRSALVNRANLNKMRAEAGLIPSLDAIRAREEGRADQLAGTRAQLGQHSFDQTLEGTNLALDQYNRNAEAIGRLGAVGHENLFRTLSTMPSNLSQTIGMNMPVRNPYAPVEPANEESQNLYDSKISDYEKAIDTNLKTGYGYRAKNRRNLAQQYAPSANQDFYYGQAANPSGFSQPTLTY